MATALAVSAVVLLVAEGRRLRTLYWHDVTQDYRYDFSRATAVPVTLEEDGFSLPAREGAWRTALLEIEISATWLGRWLEPAVEFVDREGRPCAQFLERGARGRRYVNLGSLLDHPDPAPTRVALRGRHLDWRGQQARLLLFEAPPTQAGPVLVIAPHPDDAEIAAFGLYAATDSWVVTVSAGNNVDRRMAHLEPDAVARSRLKGELRAWDSVSIPRWGGVSPARTVNLGYFNESLAAMYAEPTHLVADDVLGDTDITSFRRRGSSTLLEGTPAESSWSSLVEDLVAVLQRVQPVTVVAPHPALDAALDHKLTTIALIEALDRVGPADRTLLLYTNHHVTSEYFPFGPAAGIVSLPPWTEDPLRARGVFSHPLDEDARVRKLYALEAQHDLRPAPRYASPGPFRRVLGELVRTVRDLGRDPTDTYSYLRRGPRPNELFLVLAEADGPRLRSEMSELLSALRAGEAPAEDRRIYRP